MNFCTQEIGTRIISSEVESDGYEALNLLEKLQFRTRTTEKSNSEESSSTVTAASCSFSYSRKKGNGNGYMTEYFVKPPITLKLTFPLCIDISHIVLCPKIGNQQCSAFMIKSEVLEGWRKWQQRKREHSIEEEQKRSTSVEIIGKEYINSSPIPELLVFRNPRFLLRPEFHSLPLGRFELHRNFMDSFELKHPCFNACEDVKSLEITILRVSGSSSAALGSLQVWGQPSRQCSKSEIGTLLNKFGFQTKRSKHRREKVENDADGDDEDTTEEPLNKIRKTTEFPISPELIDSKESTTVIPEDFLDPITFEIMCQPMRLPSGIAVDLVTLEKFEAAEAQWGRPPKDPFTGKCFSETFKPLPDGALKSRIDSFLTTHSDVSEFRSLPRTLGRSQTLISRPKPTSVPKPTELSAEKIETAYHISITETAGRPDRTSDIPPNPLQIHNLGPATSTDRVSQELAKILRGNSSYLTRPKPTSSATSNSISSGESDNTATPTTCLFCKIPQKSGSGIPLAFYKSSCGHIFLCRNCIVSRNRSSAEPEPTKSCTQCGLEWRAKEMQRSHV